MKTVLILPHPQPWGLQVLGPQNSWAEENFFITFDNVLVEKHIATRCANSTLFPSSNVDVPSTW